MPRLQKYILLTDYRRGYVKSQICRANTMRVKDNWGTDYYRISSTKKVEQR